MARFDASLPGLRPTHTILHLQVDQNDVWELRVWQGDREGFRTAADWSVYDLLTGAEAQDVAEAYLSGLNLS